MWWPMCLGLVKNNSGESRWLGGSLGTLSRESRDADSFLGLPTCETQTSDIPSIDLSRSLSKESEQGLLDVWLCGWWLLEPGKEVWCQASMCPQCVLEGTLGRTVLSSAPVPTTGPAAPSMAPVSASLGGSARTAHRVSCCPCKRPSPCRQECPPETHLFLCIVSVCVISATASMWR